jgi:hypothetical protein
MKLALAYDEEMIQKLIQEDIERKINVTVPLKEIKVKVMSKQNYREHEWEFGKLKCELEVNV